MQEESKVRKFSKSIKSKVKAFWLENESKIVLSIGFILVAVIAFEFGLLQGQKWQQKPLIIEKTVASETLGSASVNLTTADQKPASEPNLAISKCAFVGSKNSNKYHSPTCQWAKRIKPENVVCFKTVVEAVAKNYQPDKGCIK